MKKAMPWRTICWEKPTTARTMASCASPTSQKAIVLKDDFTEARLLRAEALTKMQQYKEAMEDIDAILAQDPDDENAILLRGKIKEATGAEAEAEADYLHITELNPFNEQAFLYLGQLYIVQKKADRSHRFV